MWGRPVFDVSCFFCDRPFVYGPLRYEGRYLRQLDVSICDDCASAHSKGLAEQHEPKLLAYLSERGLPAPLRNDEGLLKLT